MLREGTGLSDIHITREALRAVARGELSSRVLIEFAVKHLVALCPSCCEEIAAWERERKVTFTQAAFQAWPVLLRRHRQERDEKKEAAKRDLQKLLQWPHPERLARIDRSHRRFRGTTLGAMLLSESKKEMAANPERAWEMAETAEAALRRTMAGPGVGDLLVRASAYLGNIERVRGRYPEAKKRFAFARALIRSEGVTDPLVHAEVDSCEAMLHMHQGLFTEAEELLSRSVSLYMLSGAREEAAHPLVTLGLLYSLQGSYEKALQVTRSALADIRPKRNPRLYVSARFNLALFLCESGDHVAAAEALVQDGELFQQFPDLFTQLRLAWLEGKIALGYGQLESAEEILRKVRYGFVLQERGYETAMVTLDLALVYLRQGRSAELKQLAGEMHEVFSAEEVHQEAVAALLLFEDAALRETLSADLVVDLATYLKAARHRPSLRFRRRLPG